MAMIGLVFGSCAVNNEIRTSGVHPGMTKEEVIKQLGKPDKISFYLSEDSTLYETVNYKESILEVTGFSVMYSTLRFKNNLLVSLNQREERKAEKHAIADMPAEKML